MKLAALDPSSTRVGYAVGSSRMDLIDHGAFRPGATGAKAMSRIEVMVSQLGPWLTQHRPDVVVVELPAPQAPRMGNRGQAIYGVAVGKVHERCCAWARANRAEVHGVAADEWTRRVSKKHRQLCVASDFPEYRMAHDPGGDASDAIGLMQWWFTERVVKEATA